MKKKKLSARRRVRTGSALFLCAFSLAGLMLTPQKKRGRPKEERPAREDEESTAADDAWAAFDGEASAGDGGAS